MIDLINTIRPYFEIIYFSCSSLLVAGVFLTYRQLVAITKDSEDNAARAAREKAIEACTRYLQTYVSLSSERFDIEQSEKIESYRGPIGDFTSRSVRRVTRLRAQLNNPAYARATLYELNELETIAAYFISGSADEKTGFTIIGRSFCSSVEHNYDNIAVSRSQPAVEYWSNIVALYRLWRPRLTESELIAQSTKLKAQLDAMRS